MKRRFLAGVLVLGSAACSGPVTPTTIDPMAVFAAQHSHEVCVLGTRVNPVTGNYANYAVLVPLNLWDPAMRVLPISQCNPAE